MTEYDPSFTAPRLPRPDRPPGGAPGQAPNPEREPWREPETPPEKVTLPPDQPVPGIDVPKPEQPMVS